MVPFSSFGLRFQESLLTDIPKGTAAAFTALLGLEDASNPAVSSISQVLVRNALMCRGVQVPDLTGLLVVAGF